MATIERDVEEIVQYPISNLYRGEFFEYDKRLYIKLEYKKPEEEGISCFNITDCVMCVFNKDTLVYKCEPIKIKYSLNTSRYNKTEE